MRRSIAHSPAYLALMALPAAPEAKPETFEDRMAAQRREWARRDRERFANPDREREGRADLWRVYVWRPRRRTWECVGERRRQTRRRKPMTMNRLFAALRQRYGLPRTAIVKLITEQDDRLRLARGEVMLPPGGIA